MHGAWSVQRRHVWAGLMWTVASAAVAVGFALDRQIMGNLGLVLAGASVAFTVCAATRTMTMAVREAFELGQEAERRAGRMRAVR